MKVSNAVLDTSTFRGEDHGFDFLGGCAPISLAGVHMAPCRIKVSESEAALDVDCLFDTSLGPIRFLAMKTSP